MVDLKQYFNKLKFTEKTHTYELNGNTLPSVSSLIGDFYQQFEKDKIAEAYGKKHGKTKKQVLKEWKKIADEASAKGTKFHDWAENYGIKLMNKKKPRLKGRGHMQKNCIKFWADLDDKYEIVALELRMFHKKFQYAGTADIILRNKETGNYIIGDYKTNKSLHKNYRGKKMKPPFEDLLDCPLSKYEIQLSLYQMMLEQHGLTVEDRWIIHVTPKSSYKLYKTPDHSDKLAHYYKHKELYDWLS